MLFCSNLNFYIFGWKMLALFSSLAHYMFAGVGHRHVQTHDPSGWPEDYGGDQEGDQFWRAAPGPLHRTNTGTLFTTRASVTAHMGRVKVLWCLCVFRCWGTWCTVQTWATPPRHCRCTDSGRRGSWRSSFDRATRSETEGWRSAPCATNTPLQWRRVR